MAYYNKSNGLIVNFSNPNTILTYSNPVVGIESLNLFHIVDGAK